MHSNISPNLEASKEKLSQIIRYLFSGGIGFLTNIGLLALFLVAFKLFYPIAVTLSFSLSVVVGFLLQKYFTFRDSRQEGSLLGKQFSAFVAVSLGNIALNTFFVTVMVESIGVSPFYAAAFSSGIIALWSFAAYRILVFRL